MDKLPGTYQETAPQLWLSASDPNQNHSNSIKNMDFWFLITKIVIRLI